MSFEDRDGNAARLDLVTARHFQETSKDRVMLVGNRQWEREKKVNTTATTYNGYWVYPVYIYIDSKHGHHDDYTDFTEAENAAAAFIQELFGEDVDWELGEDEYYEAQVGSREMIAAEVPVKKFATRRF